MDAIKLREIDKIKAGLAEDPLLWNFEVTLEK